MRRGERVRELRRTKEEMDGGKEYDGHDKTMSKLYTMYIVYSI